MKNKTSLLTLAATTVLASSAYSQTVIDITGSTAGRSAVHTQILALLTGETLAWNGGSNAAGATRVIYNGSYAGNPVIVRTFWSGSAAGVRDISNQPQLAASYFDKTTDTSAGTTAAGVNIPSPTLAPASAETVSEIGFSDVFQSSTAFTTNTLVNETAVGVIPFKFFRNEGSSALLTNVTPGLHNNLYKGLGEAPLSMFTGNAADTSIVYATGRDEFSGTRITCLAETGAGVFSGLNQYTGVLTGNAVTTFTFVGNGGYSSGSGVSTLLGGTYSGGIILGYLGSSDWSTAVTNGAVEVAYNGVTLGTNSDLIRNGQYSFWGYLHQFRMTLTGTSLNFYNALSGALELAPGTGLILNASMNVERAADGAAITPK